MTAAALLLAVAVAVLLVTVAGMRTRARWRRDLPADVAFIAVLRGMRDDQAGVR